MEHSDKHEQKKSKRQKRGNLTNCVAQRSRHDQSRKGGKEGPEAEKRGKLPEELS